VMMIDYTKDMLRELPDEMDGVVAAMGAAANHLFKAHEIGAKLDEERWLLLFKH
jgi:hypothetical protein